MSDADVGGDPPCWAHLFEDEECDEADDSAIGDSAIGGSVRDRPRSRPSHPKLPAALLMIGVVVFLILISLAAVR